MSAVIPDNEFLEHGVARGDHFLYVYKKNSALLRPKVRDHIKAFAEQSGWHPSNLTPGSTLEGHLNAPSLFGQMFFVSSAADFTLKDLKSALFGIAHGSFQHHAFLVVCEGSNALEEPEWLQAKDAVGLIEEPTVTIKNYRSVTRYLLKNSDLTGVQHFGEDERFFSRLKAFVHERGRSPLEMSMEIDRIILTEVKSGLWLDERRIAAGRERQVLSERLNQFLDDRSTTTLHPLLSLADSTLLARNEAGRLLVRLFGASTSIVSGSDRRYKRNREGNPAVLPYLIWGMLMLMREHQLLSGSLVVALEHLCQEYHSATKDPDTWFVHEENWQEVAICLQPVELNEPTTLEAGREELRSALAARIRELSHNTQLSWLLPLSTNANGGSDAALEHA